MSELLKRTQPPLLGEASTAEPDYHPFAGPRILEELATGVAFFKAFVNVTAVKTGEGLVLVDTGSFHPAAHRLSFDAVRGWNGERVHTAVYTHGHVDHVFGPAAVSRGGGTRDQAGAHRRSRDRDAAIRPVREDRRLQLRDQSAAVRPPGRNGRSSTAAERHLPGPTRPRPRRRRRSCTTPAVRPTITPGVWLPDRRTLCTGDLIIWARRTPEIPRRCSGTRRSGPPPCGRWQRCNRHRSCCCPGTVCPIAGAPRVRDVLLDTAELLESLVAQTLALMNDGARLDDIIHTVAAPRTCSRGPTFVRSTTIRSSSCATCGACTGAGTAACRAS